MACNNLDVAGTAEEQLRNLIRDGVRGLNVERGGRYLSEIARTVGVDRGTVSRWHSALSTPSLEHCAELTRAFPLYFDMDVLRNLYAQASGGKLADGLTVGLTSSDTTDSTYELALRSLRDPPASRREREILHVVMHVDNGLEDQAAALTARNQQAAQEFRDTVVRCARDGWRIRVVLATASHRRFESLTGMVERLDGPDVHIRGYVAHLPPVISPIVIARRDVLLAFDSLHAGLPVAAMAMRSQGAVRWATDYFERLFDDAPFRLRTPRGPNREEIARFHNQLE